MTEDEFEGDRFEENVINVDWLVRINRKMRASLALWPRSEGSRRTPR